MDIISFFPSWFLPTTLLIFFTYIFMYTILRCNSSIKLPPGPMRLPVIGNLHQLIGKDHIYQIVSNLSQTYGPIMLLHLGTQPYLFISSSEMAGQVLKTHDLKMCTRPHSTGSKRLSFNYMDAAFAPYNDHWRDMRKTLVSEFLGSKRTKLYNKTLEVYMEGLVHSLSLHSSSKTTVNLDEMFVNTVNDVAYKVALGDTYRGKTFNGRKLTEIVDETVALLSGSFSDIFPTVGWILEGLSGWNRKLEKCFTDIDGFLQMILDDHDKKETKTSDQEKDLVDDCISRLTSDEMKAILMNVFNGATDTTASTMAWAMSEIVRNPRVMQKLQTEIRTCVGRKSKVNESDLTKMTYLKMVVKETLRLHPPAGFLLMRECVSHCQIGGYDVLPGTKVVVSAWEIGRDPRTWKDSPTEFIPERFEDIQFDFGGAHFDMIPFGGGRRGCPGFNLGISTLEFTLANFLYLFNWETPVGVKNEDLDMKLDGFPFIHRVTPLCLVPIKYERQD